MISLGTKLKLHGFAFVGIRSNTNAQKHTNLNSKYLQLKIPPVLIELLVGKCVI